MKYLLLCAVVAVMACGDDKKKAKPKPPPPQPTAGLSVTSAAVRGCDVLLTDGAGKVSSVTFSDAVVGETERWAPRTAVSFVTRTDAAVSASVATVNLEGGAASITQATCYDRLGAVVASPGLELR